jgi:Flp pilus assembly protein TadG
VIDHYFQTAPEKSPNRDRGSVSAFVVIMAVALVACAGLVVDGGRLVAGRSEAADHAENAARAGAQEAADLRGDAWNINPAAASAAAQSYLMSQGVTGDVSVNGRTITVTVTVSKTMTLLGVVGASNRSVTATRTAELIDG